MINVSLVGCTGIVGQELLKLMEKKNFPVNTLRLFASKHSSGKTMSFKENQIPVECIKKDSFTHSHLIFFCTKETISKQYIPKCINNHSVIIDLSSAFREEEDVPLIIPEINFEDIKTHRLIASPNCVASIMAFAIVNIHKQYKIKRIIASTYQAASGGGIHLLKKLLQQSQTYLESQKTDSNFVAFNNYLHDSTHFADRYSHEEKKIIYEVKKILNTPEINISVTAVRVPVIRTHSISMNIELYSPFLLNELEFIIQNTKGLELVNNYQTSKFATSLDANENENVFCSRIRIDPTRKNTFEMWVVADQLLKGAALNAFQIAEKIVEKKSFLIRPS